MSNRSERGNIPVQTRWRFIDSSTDSRSNLTRVKRHVMQEYIRQKRESEGQEGSSSSHTQEEGRSSPGKPLPLIQRTTSSPNEGVDEVRRSTAPIAMGYTYTQLTSQPFQTPHSYNVCNGCAADDKDSGIHLGPLTPCSSAPTSPLNPAPSPRTIMSASRTDPFNSLPIKLNPEGKELFDFYVSVMPACSYGFHFRSSNAHNWYKDLFVPLGLEGPVAFQNTILVHAVNTKSWIRNEKETPGAIIHQKMATSMLRDITQNANPKCNSDEAIISSLSAAAVEDFDPRPERKEFSWYHMRAAKSMIRYRGGPEAFQNTLLSRLINWQDYILSGYETYDSSFSFEDSPTQTHLLGRMFPQPYANPAPIAPDRLPVHQWSPSAFPDPELLYQSTEFINFLTRCEQLSVYLKKSSYEMVPSKRHTSFREPSLLYRILAAPPAYRLTESGGRKQFIARLAALIMINAALWDYRDSRLHTVTFLEALEKTMTASEVDISGSVEALLQILLACNDGIVNTRDGPGQPDFTQYSSATQHAWGRPWFTGRMLKVAKRLSLRSWLWVQDQLLSCLALRIEMPRMPMHEYHLREEILSAPPTSYIMPALQECSALL